MRTVLVLSTLFAIAACRSQSAAPPATDSNHYQLCENDSLCPAGTSCQAGVCDLDCRADSDCAAGSCDSRGRCVVGGAVAPVVFAGSLSVSATRLDFALGQTAATLRVQNDGQATLEHFHVVSDDPAVSVSPARGALPAGEGVAVGVQLQPGWTGRATLRVLSSGGTFATVVTAGSGLAGYLQGTVNVTGPFALGTADLALDLSPDLTGVVDAESSLLWPVQAKVAATDDGGYATLTFTLVSGRHTPDNPVFDGQLERSVTLSGTHAGSGPLTGNYREVIRGLGQAPVTVTGTFQLAPSGAAHGLTPVAMEAFVPPVAPAPLAASQCSLADTLCPANLSARGAYYFDLAFPFELWGWESSIANGQCLITQGLAPVACVVPAQGLQAAEAFAQSGSPAQLWEVFRALASDGQLEGKDLIARTLQPAAAAYQGAAVDAAQLGQAVAVLQGGLHTAAGAGGLLTPANLWRAQTLSPRPSTLDKAVNDTQRFGGSVSAALFAGGQEIDRQRRLGASAQLSLATAQQLATGAFVDAAALATLDLDGTTQINAGAGTLLDSAASFAAVAAAFDQVRQGLNPVGYPAAYIPFAYDAQDPSEDLFQQLSAHAQSELTTVLSTESALESDDRQFEQSQAALTTALAGAQLQLDSQLTMLCGANAPQGSCAGGQIATDLANMNGAVLALGEAATRSANAAQKLSMLQGQLNQELNAQTVEIQALGSDGQSEAAVAIAAAREEKQNLDWQCASSVANAANSVFAGVGQVVGGYLSGGLGGLFSGIGLAASELGNTSSTAVQACEQDDNYSHHVDDAGQAALAESDAQIQIQELQNLVQDDQLITAIFDAQSDSQASFVETQRQDDLMNAAVSQWQTDLANLQQDLSNAQALGKVQVEEADPTFRLYADQNGMRWAQEMQGVRAEVFLATRAFDYMTNQSYSQEGQVFSAATAADLQAYLLMLTDAYQSYQSQYSWGQDFYDILSLRRDILGLGASARDAVTGQTLSPAQQFQALLSLPKNRDAKGNLALQFGTNTVSGGGAVFSPDVCLDRIADLKINVVSSALSGSSGYVGLSQGGDTRLVDCAQPGSVTSYALPTKSALISAGLNLPRSAATDPTVPANTDLFERPVMASAWVLSIDLADPRNAWIDLAQIDDLELWVHHRAQTLQAQ